MPVMSGPSTNPAREVSEIFVNGEARRVAAGCTVSELLAQLDLGGKRVAVAVNRDVVPRSHHASVDLRPGDRVEILEAVGGG